MLRRQTPALVGDRDRDVDSIANGAHPDGRPFGRVPGGVGEQVGQHLHDAPPVRQDRGQVRHEVHVEVEAVIGLAPNLFFGVSIPVAICVLNRDKPQERRGKVLFLDAAQEGYFRPGKAQNYIDQVHIAKIVHAYRAFEDVDRFAHVADVDEIQGNDFNLNISRYVDTTEPVEVMPVEEALTQLREAERRRDEAVARMDELLAEMGYAR